MIDSEKSIWSAIFGTIHNNFVGPVPAFQEFCRQSNVDGFIVLVSCVLDSVNLVDLLEDFRGEVWTEVG